MMRRYTAALLLAALGVATAGPARAVDPQPTRPNECRSAGGRGESCETTEDCASNRFATVCVDRGDGQGQCEAPCGKEGDEPGGDPTRCSLGENCVKGNEPGTGGSVVHYCQPQPFRVDLNLVDLCIKHYLDKTTPVFGGAPCSLQRNMNLLLDQNGDRRFDIFDVDQCILAFVEQQGCERNASGELEPETAGVRCCEADAACGKGSYCDPQLHICQRECGPVASREPSLGNLERECNGALQVCNRKRGRCETVDVTEQTCQVDQDCPSGSYCLLGRCAPRCYRATDCPNADWYCTKNNKCRALSPPESDEGFEFVPENYAIRFTRDELKLDAVQTSNSSELAIMDLVTKRQVFDNPSVAFGYRAEVSYGLKQDSQCNKTFVDCSDPEQRPPGETELECTERQDECLISPSEEWIRLDSPFGTVNAGEVPRIGVTLDEQVASELSPGTYTATLRLIFDNGTSDSIRITYVKASPSGEYEGRLTVYKGVAENALNGNRPLRLSMRIKVHPDETRQWNQLMAAHELDTDDEGLVNVTTGKLVTASLHGESTLAFTRGGAGGAVPGAPEDLADEVQFVGLYQPDSERLRMVGVIDIPKGMEIDANGGSCDPDSESLCVENLFGRDIRRRIELIGPFEPASGRFHGMYRETIFGLIPDDGLTMKGGFRMDQVIADDSPLPVDGPLGAKDTFDLPAGAEDEGIEFPSVEVTGSGAAVDVEEACEPYMGEEPLQRLLSQGEDCLGSDFSDCFERYIGQAERGGESSPEDPFGRTTIFPDLVEFRGAIEMALGALDGDNFEDVPGDPTDVERNPGEIGQAHLNIYDFLSEWIVRCDADDPSPPPGCIDESALRCGLAIHQRAILDETVSMDAVQEPSGSPDGVAPDLFCLETLDTAGCPNRANPDGEGPAEFADLFAMQEHNRFWRNLSQVLKFEADRARSDAFLTLFRNEIDPFAQGSALSYKSDRLREAMRRYNEVLELIAGTVPASTLFRWPVRSFKQMGNDWLEIMQTVASDRMDALTALVDLERRVFATTGESEYRFAHHMMQQEYLFQVYLLVLQARWQGESFAYRGEAGPILQKGQRVLQKLNPAKNPLGITPERVFFENSDTDLTNWESYRDALVGPTGDGGLVGDTRDDVLSAVDEMKSALADLDEFEEKLHESRLELKEKLGDICGDPSIIDPTSSTSSEQQAKDHCQQLLKKFDDTEDWIKLRDCKFGGVGGLDDVDASDDAKEISGPDASYCPDGVEYTCKTNCTGIDTDPAGSPGGKVSCKTNRCQDLVKTFVTNTNGIDDDDTQDGNGIHTAPKCGFEGLETSISVQGVQRPCVGGEMGELFARKALLDRKRRIVIGSVQTLVQQVQATLRFQAKRKKRGDVKMGLEFGLYRPLNQILEAVQSQVDGVFEGVDELADAPDCIKIGGFSIGTDCFGNVADAVIDGVLPVVQSTINNVLERIQQLAGYTKDIAMTTLDRQIANSETVAEIEADVREIDGLIDEYSALTQESFNVMREMQDLRYQAQAAADRYNEEVLFVAQHLVGRESGNLLRGEEMARDATVAFEDVLRLTYKMTQAFIYRYNLPPGDASNLKNEALALVTLDDVKDFVDKLDERAKNACGLAGIDCDSSNNTEVLRFSLRDQIFTQLDDVVDARTGEVVTAGERFDNTITSPPQLERRFRGTKAVEQIEIPMPIPLTAKENLPGGSQWLINPLACNHKLDGRNPDGANKHLGNVAVNVEGENLGGGERTVRYELVRGPTDRVRACTPKSQQDEIGTQPELAYPIRTWTVGYPPQNPNAQQDNPPAYSTRSAPMAACVNQPAEAGSLEGAPCWRYFARDRSLASLNWKLVIPLRIGDAATKNAWITGEGLPESEQPVIEDIEVYFRYRTRPVTEP